MGDRNCAVDGCNALEFRTKGICNRHLSMGVAPLEDSSYNEHTIPTTDELFLIRQGKMKPEEVKGIKPMKDLQISTDNISPLGKIIDSSRESLCDRLTFEVVMSYGFLIGFLAPLTPAFVLFILAFGGNADLDIFMGFMVSLILWPILGFVFSRNEYTSRKNMSTGLLISAMIGTVIAAIFWLSISVPITV